MITDAEIVAQKLAVLNAQKALSSAQAALQQLNFQKQIDALTVTAPVVPPVTPESSQS